jgi:predicted ATPase
MQWIDRESQVVLDTLYDILDSAHVLLLLNARPEYHHAWGHKPYYTQVQMTPLRSAETEAFLTNILGNDEGLALLKQHILAKTEGTPFFMEEVVHTLVEEQVLSGERGHYRLVQAVTDLHISPTIQGVIAGRIDRLAPEEKLLLQQLSVIGRTFPLALARRVIAQPADELSRILSVLQHKEFLYEEPAFPTVTYLFKHALTQEVAYNSVLIERRKVLHQQTAQAIEHMFHSQLEDYYSVLAHHYSMSGETEKAMNYLLRDLRTAWLNNLAQSFAVE